MKKFVAMVLAMLMLSACAFAEEEIYVSVVGTWELCGGMTNDVEWEQADLDAALAMYNGFLRFTFNEDLTAELVQGGGVVPGSFTYETGNEYVMVATFPFNDTELVYACQFLAMGDQIVMLLTPDGESFMYFLPVAE